MSRVQYEDTAINPIALPMSKPIHVINGGASYFDTSGINSGKNHNMKAQYVDLQYNSGNQSTQTQLDAYLANKRPITTINDANIRNERKDAQFRDLDYQAGGYRITQSDTVGSDSLIAPRKFHLWKASDKLYMK